MTIDGDTAVIGARLDDGGKGSAYVFVKDPNGWHDMTETAKLTASDGAPIDYFGTAAISGDTIVIGAHRDDDLGGESGSAYVFVKDPNGWHDMTETAKLLPSDGTANDYFGNHMAMSGDTVVISMPGDDDNGGNSGSAYVFEKGAGWLNGSANQVAKLTASDGAANDYLGRGTAFHGDTALIGADRNGGKGSAYVFVKDPNGWVDTTETAKLTASDGAAGDYFGIGVGIWGDVAVVGASSDDDNGTNSGSAYVFKKPVGGWVNMTETGKLLASDGASNDEFGDSVAVWGGTAVIGAPYDDDKGTDAGSAYVFVLDCNDNGIMDWCDISCGDPNGPCDVPGCGESLDCDGNGIPDECEGLGDDSDQDGVPNDLDVCPCVPAPCGVDAEGRPLGDLDYDCDVDLADFICFQINYTGPM